MTSLVWPVWDTWISGDQWDHRMTGTYRMHLAPPVLSSLSCHNMSLHTVSSATASQIQFDRMPSLLDDRIVEIQNASHRCGVRVWWSLG